MEKEKYVEILNRWEKGDFSQAVEEHDYMWEQAGGESGKSKKISYSKRRNSISQRTKQKRRF